MMSDEFDNALKIVLSKISNEPTLFDKVPYEILIKLIPYIGMPIVSKGVRVSLYDLHDDLQEWFNSDGWMTPSIDKCSRCAKISINIPNRKDNPTMCVCFDDYMNPCEEILCRACWNMNQFCPKCENAGCFRIAPLDITGGDCMRAHDM